VTLISGVSLLQSVIAQTTNPTSLQKANSSLSGKIQDPLKMPSWITNPQEFGEKVRAVNPESRFAIIGQETDLVLGEIPDMVLPLK
jgi:hypothetical protein